MTTKVILFLLTSVFSLSASAEPNEPDFIAEGGRLYDKWWAEYDLPKPKITHPAYPSAGKKSGANTWRCKECHGWDYKGKKGAYSKGSHYTGVTGIEHSVTFSSQKIIAILKNKTHQYNTVMKDYGLIRMASFIKYGLVDIAPSINKTSNLASGNISAGNKIYTNDCKECHGAEGQEQNFKTSGKPEYIGTVSNKNPWETIHKIRNGHPGAFVMGDPMPNMNGKLSLTDQINLLSYLQTLPI